MNKTCSMCKESKDASSFHPRKGSKDGLQFNCKSCLTEYNKTRYKRPGYAAMVRERDLKRLCGIDLELFDFVLSEQGGVCRICKRVANLEKHKWHADHDHVTGKFRGILCFNCNTALGMFNDSSERLSNAIQYLSF